ncbi:hypothetical protein OQA88_9295 [Cercophora sp. LCS_1]
MLFGYRILGLTLFVLAALFLLFRPSRLHQISPLQYLRASGKASPDILNATLGFQEVLVLNLPERTDRRDAMTLAAAVTGIDLTWIDGVSGKDVPDKVLPGDSVDKGISKGNKGSWRAHMNALQYIIQKNLTTALILEDDADWDIRLKSQLQIFAQAAHAFTQPSPQPFSSTFPLDSPSELSLSQLPTALRPKLTPYGDAFDVLWLGHCGTSLPQPIPDNISPSPPPLPLLRVTIPNDPTVPAPKDMKPHPFALKDEIADLYPPHTRVVHASKATACTQAYAVSQQGARKLLWRFGLETLTNGWDFMLKDWCDGLHVGADEKAPVCVTVQPPLFSHHFGKGAASDITAPGGGFISKEKEMTPYLRWSVRLNLGRLVGGGSVEDQFGEE